MHAAGFLATITPLLLYVSDARAGDGAQERAAKKACLIGDVAKGVEILTDLFIDTNDPTYIFNQGRCFEQNRRYEDAIARFREYLIKDKKASADERADAEKHIVDCQSYLTKGEPQVGGAEPAKPTTLPVQGANQDVAGSGIPYQRTDRDTRQVGNVEPRALPPVPRGAADAVAPEGAKPEGPPPHHRRAPGALWLAIASGSGFVYHGRQSVDTRDKTASGTASVPVAAGFLPASLLQFEPELGMQVADRFSLSILVRYQLAPKEPNGYTPGPGENEILTSAVAGFLRAQVAFLNFGDVQTYLSGGGGFGRSFLGVVSRECNQTSCPLTHSDTLHGGSLGVLAGLGVIYHLSPNVGVFFDAKEILTFRTILGLSEFNLGLAVAVDLLD